MIFLTTKVNTGSLLNVLANSSTGIDTPFTKGRKTPPMRFFYVLMMDWAGPASAGPLPLGGSVNPVQSVTHRLTPLSDGHIKHPKEANHA